MTDISIDLAPDPQQDAAARRAALGLLAAGHDADEAVVHEHSGVALNELLARVVGPVEVRPESAPALQAMLSTAARQFTAFAAVAYVFAEEAFAAGQREPYADGPDHAQLLTAVSQVLEQLAVEGR